MWLFYFVTLAAVFSGNVIGFPQNEAPTSAFDSNRLVFDGPTSRPSLLTQRTTTVALPSTTAAQTDAQYNACVDTCPSTNEYNPVCGSDNVMYDSPGRLNCAASCGKDITLRHYGRCVTSQIRG